MYGLVSVNMEGLESVRLKAYWRSCSWRSLMEHCCHLLKKSILVVTSSCRTTAQNIPQGMHAAERLRSNGVNWWKTPAESSDLNPIENLWHELKEYIWRKVKPKTNEELIRWIIEFWGTVDKNKCRKYIRHLKKVMPKVIELLQVTR